MDPNAQNSERGIYCMTKVKNPPPLRLLSVASKGVPLVINFGLETVFFSQIFFLKRRSGLKTKGRALKRNPETLQKQGTASK